MAYTLLTHTSLGSTDGFSVTTSDIDTSGADLIVIAVSGYTTAISSVSDNKSNTINPLTNVGAGAINARLYYITPTTVGTGHHFTASQLDSPKFPGIAVACFSGRAASPFDQENGAVATQPGSVTPSENNELLVCGLSWYPSGTVAIDSSFSITDQVDYLASNHLGCALAYQIQTTATARNPTWSGVSFSEQATPIATFKAAAGGGGVVVPFNLFQHSA